jgi:serine/threonine-protein kinase RsbW
LDTISLTIPAQPAYLQVVRLIAAGLASRLGFTVDEIEDLRIAVDELSAYLTGSQGREGELDIRFILDGNALCIEGVGNLMPGQKVRTELTDMSRMILQTVVDKASLDQRDGKPNFSLTKSKQTA